MSKNFSLCQTAQDGRFSISIWKVGASASGYGRGWYVSDVPFEKQADIHAQIMDIIVAAGGQPDFDGAAELIDQKFRALCIQLGCPLVSAI
jgi:hypothetical protein